MDITIASALISGVAALLGAVIGGIVVLAAQKRAIKSQNETNEHNNKLHLLLELINKYEINYESRHLSNNGDNNKKMAKSAIAIIDGICIIVSTMNLSKEHLAILKSYFETMNEDINGNGETFTISSFGFKKNISQIEYKKACEIMEIA